MSDGTLISAAYREQQAALHSTGKYGHAARQFGHVVQQALNAVGARSLLDYGCGSNRSLLQAITLPEDVVYEGYDPCVPAYASDPCPADLVVCIDVLEHVEPHLLENVLDHLASVCDPHGLFTISTGPAIKTLPDGRNAHLIQQPRSWWLPRLQTRFQVLETGTTPDGFFVFVRRA